MGKDYLMAHACGGARKFCIEIIKPSHYDDAGYVIQWYRAIVPSNSLACVYGLVADVAQRRALDADVELDIRAYDECQTVIPVRKIIRRIQAADGRGLVILAGVQTNQFPRAMDLARQFRSSGIAVAIGGFHVSGLLAMSDELPDDIRQLEALGVSVFAGEAEGRMEGLLRDALEGRLQPLYNYLGQLPELQGQPGPCLPREIVEEYAMAASVDCGRGCPFQCSFCTIINVQGRKSRWRNADDIERIVRTYLAQGIHRFFITDDNFARNKNWEAIFDRLIYLREVEGHRIKLMLQADVMSHQLPGFIEKAGRAGCSRVFLGLESINPDNLAQLNKGQNHIEEYRAMLLAWRAQKVVTHAGYILGLPGDTPESIARDLRTIQRELPIDMLEFMMLTPLPGSADHKAMRESGAWMDPDLNKYDLEHVTCRHPRMTREQWEVACHCAWQLYYSPEHIETLLRRAVAAGGGLRHMANAILWCYGSYRFEHLHPFQSGLVRRKVRTTRRPGLPRENPLRFYPRRAWEMVKTYAGFARFALKLELLCRRIERDPTARQYTDAALGGPPVVPPPHCLQSQHSRAG